MAEPTVPPALRAQVEQWIADDPDPAARAELRALLHDGAAAELAERFRGPLAFGTAGLRGALGAGPARMNVATVRRATGGLARWLHDTVPGAAAAGVVVGHDARHGSAAFAEATVAVLEGAGVRALRLPAHLPTPVLAYAVPALGAAAGVMVTASHNPPQDNGYKVYLASGAQIAPPVDEEIAAEIAAVTTLAGQPLGGPGERVGDGVVEDYLTAALGALGPGDERDVRLAYSAMHGVAGALVVEALRRAGFPAPHVVAEQQEPDPAFPTVEKPNPEEPAALARVLALAGAVDADLALATDPDGDRLAAAIPEEGGWRVLTGDEIGSLLASDRLARDPDPASALVVATLGSTTLLARIAEAAGAEHVETLTGFKWVMREALARPDRHLAIGFEEALGYALVEAVRDKDGIAAALALAQVAAVARAHGTTIGGRLDELACRFGLHATGQVTLELPGSAGRERIAGVMRRLREQPPEALDGRPVLAVDDLRAGRRRHRDGHTEPRGLPPADVVVLHGDPWRVVARPSGTEPKLKVYLQVVEPVDGGDVAAARARGAAALAGLRAAVDALLA